MTAAVWKPLSMLRRAVALPMRHLCEAHRWSPAFVAATLRRTDDEAEGLMRAVCRRNAVDVGGID